MFTPAKVLKNNTNTPAATATPFFSMAHRVMPVGMGIQRKCDACEKEEKKQVQGKETVGSSAGGKTAPAIVSNVLSSGSGQPMDTGARQFMENRFGQDFGQVRIHVGNQAAESATAIQARAYTSGKDIVFGAGEYQPGSESGRRLLAHELAHVGQQGGGIQKRPETQPSAAISYNSGMGVQRSWFGDDEESMPESASGGGILDWAKEQADSAVDTVTQAGGDAYDWAKEQASLAVDTVTQAGGDAYDWTKEQGNSAVDTVTQAGGDAYDWAKEQGSAALEGATDSVGNIWDSVTDSLGNETDAESDVNSIKNEDKAPIMQLPDIELKFECCPEEKKTLDSANRDLDQKMSDFNAIADKGKLACGIAAFSILAGSIPVIMTGGVAAIPYIIACGGTSSPCFSGLIDLFNAKKKVEISREALLEAMINYFDCKDACRERSNE